MCFHGVLIKGDWSFVFRHSVIEQMHQTVREWGGGGVKLPTKFSKREEGLDRA